MFTPFSITKFITTASDNDPPDALLTVILNEPAATAPTDMRYDPAVPPEAIAIIGTSVAATVEFVTVNDTSAAAASAAPFIVICPLIVFIVTPVVLFVA